MRLNCGGRINDIYGILRSPPCPGLWERSCNLLLGGVGGGGDNNQKHVFFFAPLSQAILSNSFLFKGPPAD